MVPEGWILPIELLILELGLLVTLVVIHRIAVREVGPGPRSLRASAPWAALSVGLSVAGIWLLMQPMEMRGTVLAG
jgi:hypothetical protein